MRLAAQRRRRRGVTVIESAFILPLVIIILLAIIIGAVGVSSYQEVASIARDGARYASVRGYQYNMYTANPPATPSDVYNNAIRPRMSIIDPANVTYSVTWSPDNKPGSLVTVHVQYVWMSAGIFGNLTMSSTSTVLMEW